MVSFPPYRPMKSTGPRLSWYETKPEPGSLSASRERTHKEARKRVEGNNSINRRRPFVSSLDDAYPQ